MSRTIWLVLVLLAAVPPCIRSEPPDLAALDGLVADALEAWRVPGAAVVVVQGERVLFLKGFGVREVRGGPPVTPDTVFPLASCSKAFTTTALAMLADAGRLDWDDPVRQHLPFFHLADPLADGDARLRDLVTHRTGVASHDLLWYAGPWSTEEAVRRVAHLTPSRPFRTTFQYQSTMFTAAGLVVGRAAGTSWRQFVQERLLDPLEMKATVFTTDEALQAADHARPHRLNEQGQAEAIPVYRIAEPNAAGSLHASARDLSKWLRFQLGDGTWRGKRLVSAANLGETHTPQIPLRLEGIHRAMNPHSLQMSYGLAWVIQDYRGHLLWSHAGAIDGFRAHVSLVPEARLGIAVLSNLNQTRLNLALANTLLDHMLGQPYKDWNTYYIGVLRQDRETDQKLRRQREEARRPEQRPSHVLPAFAGTYANAAYGRCRVTLEQGRLVWKWASIRCELEHHHDDTFTVAKYEPTLIESLGLAEASFLLGSKREVQALRFLDVDFAKVAE